MKISTNFPKPTNPYARKPRQLMSAKTTTIECDSFPDGPLPKRVPIHSAPVATFDRRNQAERNTIMKIWLNTGHSQGIQMDFIP